MLNHISALCLVNKGFGGFAMAPNVELSVGVKPGHPQHMRAIAGCFAVVDGGFLAPLPCGNFLQRRILGDQAAQLFGNQRGVRAVQRIDAHVDAQIRVGAFQVARLFVASHFKTKWRLNKQVLGHEHGGLGLGLIAYRRLPCVEISATLSTGRESTGPVKPEITQIPAIEPTNMLTNNRCSGLMP